MGEPAEWGPADRFVRSAMGNPDGMKPQFSLQAASAAVGCAAVAIMGALSVAAATGESTAAPGGAEPTTTTMYAPVGSESEVTTTTPQTAMSFRPGVTATTPAPPTD